ncbi:hypothetical protein BC628DRAFT_1499126 [Trametes gibbosa]|nr:hypothetical protein BC628DRAFT_1499126 [Trametes gibbosa]
MKRASLPTRCMRLWRSLRHISSSGALTALESTSKRSDEVFPVEIWQKIVDYIDEERDLVSVALVSHLLRDLAQEMITYRKIELQTQDSIVSFCKAVPASRRLLGMVRILVIRCPVNFEEYVIRSLSPALHAFNSLEDLTLDIQCSGAAEERMKAELLGAQFPALSILRTSIPISSHLLEFVRRHSLITELSIPSHRHDDTVPDLRDFERILLLSLRNLECDALSFQYFSYTSTFTELHLTSCDATQLGIISGSVGLHLRRLCVGHIRYETPQQQISLQFFLRRFPCLTSLEITINTPFLCDGIGWHIRANPPLVFRRRAPLALTWAVSEPNTLAPSSPQVLFLQDTALHVLRTWSPYISERGCFSSSDNSQKESWCQAAHDFPSFVLDRAKPEQESINASTIRESSCNTGFHPPHCNNPLPRRTIAESELEVDDEAWRADLSLEFERQCYSYAGSSSLDGDLGVVPADVQDGLQSIGASTQGLTTSDDVDSEQAAAIFSNTSFWQFLEHNDFSEDEAGQSLPALHSEIGSPGSNFEEHAIGSTDTDLLRSSNEGDAAVRLQDPNSPPALIDSTTTPTPTPSPSEKNPVSRQRSPLINDVTFELLPHCDEPEDLQTCVLLDDPTLPPNPCAYPKRGRIRIRPVRRRVEKSHRRDFLHWRALWRNPVLEGARDEWFKATVTMPYSSLRRPQARGTPPQAEATGSLRDYTCALAYYELDDLISNQAELAWMESEHSPYYDSDYARSMFGDDDPQALDLDVRDVTDFAEDAIFQCVGLNGELKCSA